METFEPTGQQAILILLLLAWSFVWKGIALWTAATNRSKGWYIALLVLNTLGILEMLYIFVFSKKQQLPIEQ